jgi:hypothetical protein
MVRELEKWPADMESAPRKFSVLNSARPSAVQKQTLSPFWKQNKAACVTKDTPRAPIAAFRTGHHTSIDPVQRENGSVKFRRAIAAGCNIRT